jgi:hypothetical protein
VDGKQAALIAPFSPPAAIVQDVHNLVAAQQKMH